MNPELGPATATQRTCVSVAVAAQRFAWFDESLLVRMIGFPATLIHGDTAVLDRWIWLRTRLPHTRNVEKLVDVGCGTGAFSIGAARRGYEVLGLSWSERNQVVAAYRARLCGATRVSFDVLDVRHLDTRTDLADEFDVAICCETIEHIIDDRKLMIDIAALLKPGGRLLLTTPYYYYRPVGGDEGPFVAVEDGAHVRRGYTRVSLAELCVQAGLVVENVSFCTGFLSQKWIFISRKLSAFLPRTLVWALLLPLRMLPHFLDPVIGKVTSREYYSICLEAYKPRYDG